MLTRRQFIPALAGLAIAQAVPGCGWLADRNIAVAGHVWVGYEPTFLARNEGWLDSALVGLVETKSATESLKALVEGQVDGAMLTLDETLRARVSGIALTVVMVFDVSAGADSLLVRPGIKTLAELKGRRIGFEASAVGELLLAIILDKAMLGKSDVHLVPLKIEQQRDAWVDNQLDALITYEPVASQIANLPHADRSAVRLFDTRQAPNLVTDVLAMRSSVLDRAHAKAIRNLIAGHFRGLDHLQTNPQDAAYRMAGRLGLSAKDVLAAYKGLMLPDAANNLRLLAGASPELLKSAKNLSAIMVKNHLLKQDDSLETLIRADYLPTPSSAD